MLNKAGHLAEGYLTMALSSVLWVSAFQQSD